MSLYKYNKTFPALEIASEFLRAVFDGRKNWEIRKRLVEPLKPIVIINTFQGWPRVAAVAVFDRAMFGTPADILGKVAECGGDACVDQAWVDRYAGKAKELVAMRYFKILAFEPECVFTDPSDDGRRVEFCTDKADDLASDVRTIYEGVVRDGVDVQWLFRSKKGGAE